MYLLILSYLSGFRQSLCRHCYSFWSCFVLLDLNWNSWKNYTSICSRESVCVCVCVCVCARACVRAMSVLEAETAHRSIHVYKENINLQYWKYLFSLFISSFTSSLSVTLCLSLCFSSRLPVSLSMSYFLSLHLSLPLSVWLSVSFFIPPMLTVSLTHCLPFPFLNPFFHFSHCYEEL